MFEIPDELLRKIVREAMLELGAEPEPAILRKIVKAVVHRLNPQRPEFTATPSTSPPVSTYSQY